MPQLRRRLAKLATVPIEQVRPIVQRVRDSALGSTPPVRYGIVRGVGVERLDDPQIVELGQAGTCLIRRKARKVRRTVAGVNLEKLTGDDRAKAMSISAVAGFVEKLTKAPAMAQIGDAVKDAPKLDVGKIVNESLKLWK